MKIYNQNQLTSSSLKSEKDKKFIFSSNLTLHWAELISNWNNFKYKDRTADKSSQSEISTFSFLPKVAPWGTNKTKTIPSICMYLAP